MSVQSGKTIPQFMITGTVISIFGSIFALTADCADGSELKKSNRMVVHQAKEVRNYDRPRRNGNRIAFCITDAVETCGKPAADAFCRDNDFQEALTFQRERMEGH